MKQTFVGNEIVTLTSFSHEHHFLGRSVRVETTVIALGKITGAACNYPARTYITEDQDPISLGDKEMEISHRFDFTYLHTK